MAEFYVSLSVDEMAAQVAGMLNMYNRWATRFNARSISLTPARYFVEIDSGKVVGCASNIPYDERITKIQHICVLPEYRGRGIAKKLTEMAIMHCGTDLVFMTIRQDNTASLALARSLGFVYVTKHWFRDHWTLTFGRRKQNDCSRSSQYV
jgi:ribosomal protein S18 acetylase RimI-like enzyme